MHNLSPNIVVSASRHRQVKGVFFKEVIHSYSMIDEKGFFIYSLIQEFAFRNRKEYYTHDELFHSVQRMLFAAFKFVWMTNLLQKLILIFFSHNGPSNFYKHFPELKFFERYNQGNFYVNAIYCESVLWMRMGSVSNLILTRFERKTVWIEEVCGELN